MSSEEFTLLDVVRDIKSAKRDPKEQTRRMEEISSLSPSKQKIADENLEKKKRYEKVFGEYKNYKIFSDREGNTCTTSDVLSKKKEISQAYTKKLPKKRKKKKKKNIRRSHTSPIKGSRQTSKEYYEGVVRLKNLEQEHSFEYKKRVIENRVKKGRRMYDDVSRSRIQSEPYRRGANRYEERKKRNPAYSFLRRSPQTSNALRFVSNRKRFKSPFLSRLKAKTMKEDNMRRNSGIPSYSDTGFTLNTTQRNQLSEGRKRHSMPPGDMLYPPKKTKKKKRKRRFVSSPVVSKRKKKRKKKKKKGKSKKKKIIGGEKRSYSLQEYDEVEVIREDFSVKGQPGVRCVCTQTPEKFRGGSHLGSRRKNIDNDQEEELGRKIKVVQQQQQHQSSSGVLWNPKVDKLEEDEEEEYIRKKKIEDDEDIDDLGTSSFYEEEVEIPKEEEEEDLESKIDGLLEETENSSTAFEKEEEVKEIIMKELDEINKMPVDELEKQVEEESRDLDATDEEIYGDDEKDLLPSDDDDDGESTVDEQMDSFEKFDVDAFIESTIAENSVFESPVASPKAVPTVTESSSSPVEEVEEKPEILEAEDVPVLPVEEKEEEKEEVGTEIVEEVGTTEAVEEEKVVVAETAAEEEEVVIAEAVEEIKEEKIEPEETTIIEPEIKKEEEEEKETKVEEKIEEEEKEKTGEIVEEETKVEEESLYSLEKLYSEDGSIWGKEMMKILEEAILNKNIFESVYDAMKEKNNNGGEGVIESILTRIIMQEKYSPEVVFYSLIFLNQMSNEVQEETKQEEIVDELGDLIETIEEIEKRTKIYFGDVYDFQCDIDPNSIYDQAKSLKERVPDWEEEEEETPLAVVEEEEEVEKKEEEKEGEESFAVVEEEKAEEEEEEKEKAEEEEEEEKVEVVEEPIIVAEEAEENEITEVVVEEEGELKKKEEEEEESEKVVGDGVDEDVDDVISKLIEEVKEEVEAEIKDDEEEVEEVKGEEEQWEIFEEQEKKQEEEEEEKWDVEEQKEGEGEQNKDEEDDEEDETPVVTTEGKKRKLVFTEPEPEKTEKNEEEKTEVGEVNQEEERQVIEENEEVKKEEEQKPEKEGEEGEHREEVKGEEDLVFAEMNGNRHIIPAGSPLDPMGPVDPGTIGMEEALAHHDEVEEEEQKEQEGKVELEGEEVKKTEEKEEVEEESSGEKRKKERSGFVGKLKKSLSEGKSLMKMLSGTAGGEDHLEKKHHMGEEEEEKQRMKERFEETKKTAEEKRQEEEELRQLSSSDETQEFLEGEILNSELDFLSDLLTLQERYSSPCKKLMPEEKWRKVFSDYEVILNFHNQMGEEFEEEEVNIIDVFSNHSEGFSQTYLVLFINYKEILKCWRDELQINEKLRVYIERTEAGEEVNVEELDDIPNMGLNDILDGEEEKNGEKNGEKKLETEKKKDVENEVETILELFSVPGARLGEYRELFNKLCNFIDTEHKDYNSLQTIIATLRSLKEQQELFSLS